MVLWPDDGKSMPMPAIQEERNSRLGGIEFWAISVPAINSEIAAKIALIFMANMIG